ncbi:YecM protein [Seminavis robusta]|uniref:YecM protein n=1 Tax=Seminavis robusta TaxID=568900 RepID=A0A9N8E0D8_9STRA|nr:YecM protein [Seminavis robusta]|eukprot:Sro386_g131830.1 YecM protein (229) ;mRNA; r:12256-12942
MSNATKSASLASEFLSRLKQQVPPFVETIVTSLAKTYQLDVSRYPADHVCYRTENMAEYAELTAALRQQDSQCILLIESEIGNRPIATFWLQEGIRVSSLDRIIHVLEIPAPKRGRAYPRGLEHVEFVIHNNSTTTTRSDQYPSPVNGAHHQAAFDDLMRQRPNVPWDTRARNKEINPDISLKLELQLQNSPTCTKSDAKQCSVKFHLVPLDKVIEFETMTGKVDHKS